MGLIFQNISKKYGAVVAIKHAEMEIENGEVRAILGGNDLESRHWQKLWVD